MGSTHCRDTGKNPETLHKFRVIDLEGFLCLKPLGLWHHIKSKQTRRLESGIHLKYQPETLDEHPGTGKQHQGQRHFGHQEAGTKSGSKS